MPDIRTTGKLDDFERPDEHPVEAPWFQLDASGVWANNHLHAGRLENPLGFPYSEPGTAITWSYFADSWLRGDFEAWGIRHGGEAGAAGTGWRIGFFRDTTVGGSGAQGYIVLFFTAIGDAVQMRKYTSPASFANVGTTYATDFKDYLMLRKTGSLLEAFSSPDTVTWTLMADVTMDAWVDDYFYMAYGVEDPTAAGTGWQEVGGSYLPRRGQIYRRLRN